jgi:catechol 2,3-dioxygenase-like lactoylglutathione lyase family enzyme
MAWPLFQKVGRFSLPMPDLDAALDLYTGSLGHALIWRSDTMAGPRLPGSNAELVLPTDTRGPETALAVPDGRPGPGDRHGDGLTPIVCR